MARWQPRFPALQGLLLVAALGATACVRDARLFATTLQPAEIPILDAQRIWIVSGHLDEELRVARLVELGLRRRSRVEVRRIERDWLEPWRAQGRIPAGTLVLWLDLQFLERTRSEWVSRPDSACGPYGCYPTTRSYAYDVPVVRAELAVAVYDGPSAILKRRITFREALEGRDYDELRYTLTERLANEVAESTAIHPKTVRVRLRLVRALPQVGEAIEAAKRGDWAQARQLCEEARKSERWASLSKREQAYLSYDLAQTRRYDLRGFRTPDERFASAEAAIREAWRLERDPDFLRTLSAIRSDRRKQAMLEAQQRELREREQNRGKTPPPPSYAPVTSPSTPPSSP